MIQYGGPPKVIGEFKLEPKEMMYYLYLPILMTAQGGLRMPENLSFIKPLTEAAMLDFVNEFGISRMTSDAYIYATVKTMFVQPGSPGNREGWHADGFGSGGDINYIWSDMNPTEFAVQDFFEISEDDRQSMVQFGEQFNGNPTIYPNNTLLRLDESVVHRVAPTVETGIRTFVKLSFSKHRFANKFNSHNYLFDYEWELAPRSMERNLDSKEAK